jgi:competence protein ComEC
LKLHDVYATARLKNVQILSQGKPSFWRDVYSVKHSFVKSLEKIYSGDDAGMLAGVLIGQKSLLSEGVLNELAQSGLTHLIVLSGYNITVIALFMMRLLAACFVALFIAATGFTAASVRPAIMVIMLFSAQIATRQANIFRVILIALLAMVIASPIALVYDVSLQLSFIGFLGLAYLSPIIEPWFEKFDEWHGMRDLVSETIAVQVSVLPYLIWMSGIVSLLVIVSNAITVAIVPLVMAAGFFDVLLGFISTSLAKILALPVKFCLAYFLSVAKIVAACDFLILKFPSFSGWWIFTIYSFLGILVWFLLRKIQKEKTNLVKNKKH